MAREPSGRAPWALLGVTPPRPGASRVGQLRFVRDLQARLALVLAPISLVLLVLEASGWTVVLSLAALGMLVTDAAYLTAKIRRERARAA